MWEMPKGHLVILCNHPERCNKIQEKFKSSKLTRVSKHLDHTIYDIKPVDGKGPVHNISWCQLQDLERTKEDEGSNGPDTSKHGWQVPLYNPKVYKP